MIEPHQPQTKTPKDVIRAYLTISGFYTLSASVIWGVNTLFLLDAGLDLLGVFVASAVFSASMALFEIPTGVLADTRGRRASVLLSVVVLFVGTLGYVGVAASGRGLAWFCLMSVVLGLGYSVYSGAVEAWLVDALQATAYDGPLDRVFARGSMVSGSAMLLGTVGGGVLGSLDLALPFYLRAVLMVIVFFVALAVVHDLGYNPRELSVGQLPAEMSRIARESIELGWGQRSVRLLIVASLVQSAFVAWGYQAWQPYFLELLGKDLVWVAGVIAALIAIATIAGNALVEWVSRTCGKRTTLLGWAALVHGLAALGTGLAGSFWLAVPMYLLSMACLGVIGPVRQAYLHQLVPSDRRATVVSFDSLVSAVGSSLGAAGVGQFVQVRSLASGYVMGGAVSLLVLPVVALLRRRNDEADQIIGMAGVKGPCAAQGMPEVAGVDTRPRAS